MPRGGSYPCMFLSFLISIRVRLRLRLITACGLEGAHTTHIHLTSHTNTKSHTNMQPSPKCTRLFGAPAYEYINRLMLQIYVPINGALEHAADITNTSASWQRPSARLHSWHPRFCLSLFLCPVFNSREVSLHYVQACVKECVKKRLLSI